MMEVKSDEQRLLSAMKLVKLLRENPKLKEVVRFLFMSEGVASFRELYERFPWLTPDSQGGKELVFLYELGLIAVRKPASVNVLSTSPNYPIYAEILLTWLGAHALREA